MCVCLCVCRTWNEATIESDVVTWVCWKIQIMLSFEWISKNRQSHGVGRRNNSAFAMSLFGFPSQFYIHLYENVCVQLKECFVRRFQHLPAQTMLTSRVLHGYVKNSTVFGANDEHSCTIHWHNLIYLLCWHDVCKWHTKPFVCYLLSDDHMDIARNTHKQTQTQDKYITNTNED